MTAPATIRWLRYDGGEREWSEPHALEPAPCRACCRPGPQECPDCGGRVHHEFVESGWEMAQARLCERCRIDELDEPAEVEFGPAT